MQSKFAIAAIAACAIAMAGASSSARADVAAFYTGRQIAIVVASTPGGGYDTYARLVARHMGRHIPGDPKIIVSNMSGAGGNLAAGYIVNSQPHEGAHMALVLPPTIMGGLYETVQKLRYDPAQLVHIGSANSEVDMCFARGDSGVTTIKDAMTKTLVVGGSAEGSVSRAQPAILNNLLGTKFRVVSGYPGTRQILLAIESGEVAGVCGISYKGLLLQKPDWIKNGFIKMLAQNNAKGLQAINDLGVPRSPDLAPTPQARQALELIFAQQEFGRPFVVAPGTPQDRVAALRKAFMAAMNDKALRADAAALKLDIDPTSGEELQTLVKKLYAMPQQIVDSAKDAQIYRAPK